MYQLQNEYGDISQHFLSSEEEIAPSIDSHCSVLIRASSDGSRLFASHDTWSAFAVMLRVYKFYTLPFSRASTKSTTVAFSSYPANLQSQDDYYVTGQNLVVMETTNEIFNHSLYTNYVLPTTVPFWIRVVVANRMATGGEEWSNTFGKFNSGTYNNQYQIVDYKLFTPGKSIQANTLWICEQVPGFIVAEDMTSYLQGQGYWPSYNIPYFPFIYNVSGYPTMFNKYGNEYSYPECARAQIFRRDAQTVQTLEDMKVIMRYNKYQFDPLSLKDACKGISARCDLNTPWAVNTLNGMNAFGGIDSKITDNTLVPQFNTIAVCGPTWNDQPVFAWTGQWASIPHYGMPKLYNFEFVELSPNPTK